MKKALCLILAFITAFGCMSISAFATGTYELGSTALFTTNSANSEPSGTNLADHHTGSMDIKANVEESLSYEMVIPASTAVLTGSNHENVVLPDAAGVINVEGATDEVRIYYTVNMENANFTDGNGHGMTAVYEYDQGNGYRTLSENSVVEVYNGASVENSTIRVSVSDNEWKKVPLGDYSAALVFTFDHDKVKTVGSMLRSVSDPGFPEDTADENEFWYAFDEDGNSYALSIGTDKNAGYVTLKQSGKAVPVIPICAEVLPEPNETDYSLESNGMAITFVTEEEHLTRILVERKGLELTFAPLEKVPVSDIVAMAEDAFPQTLVDSWFNSKGDTVCYIENGGVCLYQYSKETAQMEYLGNVLLTAQAYRFGEVYKTSVSVGGRSYPVVFATEDGALTAISAVGILLCPGPMTIGKLRYTLFGTAAPEIADLAWHNGSSMMLYCRDNNSALCVGPDGNNVIMNIPYMLPLTKNGSNYEFSEGGIKIAFALSGGAVSSVSLSGVPEGSLNGVYQAPVTKMIAELLVPEDDFPTAEASAWADVGNVVKIYLNNGDLVIKTNNYTERLPLSRKVAYLDGAYTFTVSGGDPVQFVFSGDYLTSFAVMGGSFTVRPVQPE